ncbi:hypothetical protein Tco_1063372 [Tanacetum coccineum]
MTTLAEHIIVAGAENRPPMLEKSMYDIMGKSIQAGQILDEEQLAFLADHGISKALVAQQTIPQNSAFQTDDLDAYDSDYEITEVQIVFNQMEAAVDQCVVDKNIFEIQIKQLRIDNDQLLNQIMSQEIVHVVANVYQFDSIGKTRVQSKEHCDSLIAQINAKSVENSDLNAQLQEKVFAITALKNELRKLKRKNVVNIAISKPNATIDPGISLKPSRTLVVVTSINKDKRVRFAELVTSSNNIPKQTDSLKTKDSNKPLLNSTRVKPTTSASESKPSGNTKNNRITRPPHRNQNNKVEDHSRKVKSSLNKTNSVFESISNALVKHSMKNAKFESICAICNKCLFDANHDMCLIDFVKDVNVRSKSKSNREIFHYSW